MPRCARKSRARCNERRRSTTHVRTQSARQHLLRLGRCRVGMVRIDAADARGEDLSDSVPLPTSTAEHAMSAQLAKLFRSLFPNPPRVASILHVDDDEAMRRSTAMLLRSAGFETREAAHRRTGAGAGGGAARPARRADRRLPPGQRHDRHRSRRGVRQVVRPRGADGHPHRRSGQRRSAVAHRCAGVGGAQAAAPETLLAALPPLVAFRRAVAAAASR